MKAEITYVAVLDELDEQRAMFIPGSTGVVLRLPRDAWEAMDRPTCLKFTLRAER